MSINKYVFEVRFIVVMVRYYIRRSGYPKWQKLLDSANPMRKKKKNEEFWKRFLEISAHTRLVADPG